MRYLLDTHVLLWVISNAPQLSAESKAAIVNIENKIYVSIISESEIAIKDSIGKLKLNSSFAAFAKQIDELEVIHLPITRQYLNCYEQLHLRHRYPFDKLLIAQAIAENSTIITADKAFAQYQQATLLLN
jgi:PIN domain nuclease of toxin-antitoxin system